MARGHFHQALLSIGRFIDLVAVGLETYSEQPAKLHLIVDDDNDRLREFIFHCGVPDDQETSPVAAVSLAA